MSNCQDSGAQILSEITQGTAWCGSCGKVVPVRYRPSDSNQIPHYATH